MSTIKKLLALVLALTMVLSVSAFAGYTVAPYGDYAGIDADAEEAVQLLYSLNIMKGDNKGNFNPEATITRAEVAKMVYVVLNYGEDDLAKNYTGAKFFSDVETGAWYEGYVNYAASIKLVQGRPDGTFGPNDPVTCAEAAKMLLTAIGYSAEARGYIGANWDKQVLSDASILGLLDGYNYNTQTYAPRQWVAVMFMNALTGALTYDTIVPTTFNGLLTGENYGSYTTMGWKYFGLYAWEGIITANEYADLYNDEALSSGNTKIDKGEYTFKNWTTDLTEIGEYRRGWAVEDGSKDEVVYVTDDGVNTEFSCGGAVTIKKANIDGIKLNSDTVYYQDFESTKAYKADDYVAKGDWLRVVDNDDDGTAEFVFVTEFTMDAVTKVTSSKLTLSKVAATEDFATDSDLAKGDIVVYAYIDGVYFVEAADEFAGEVDKYTYRNKTLTVDGEDYDQTEIDVATGLDYYYDLEDARKEVEYTYYQDFFGNIGLFSREKADAGELVLLTNAYYANDRYGKIAAVDAYLDGEITDTDVKTSSSTDWTMFIDNSGTSNNNWSKLKPFDTDSLTHVARYSQDDEGVMSLYSALTWDYNHKGEEDEVITDYITLDTAWDADNELFEAGQRTYAGSYKEKGFDADGDLIVTEIYDVEVQANKDTVFYYVSYPDGRYFGGEVIETVVGYKNSYDVTKELVDEVYSVYAVGTNVSSEYVDKDGSTDDKTYWVADVIVIETKNPAFALDSQVVLGYNVVNKTYDDYAALDVINADASLGELKVINKDGDSYNKFKQDGIDVLDFYWTTTDADGYTYIRSIPAAKYAAYDIYAGTLNRVVKLGDEYVVTVDGIELEYDAESVVVYDIVAGKRANDAETTDSDDETLELTKGETYVFFGDANEEIVYAVLVNDALTEALYDKVVGTPGLSAAQDAAIEALEKHIVDALKAADTTGVIADYEAALADDEIELGLWASGDHDTLAEAVATWTDELAGKAAGEIEGHLAALKAVGTTAANKYVELAVAAQDEAEADAAAALAGLTVEVKDGKSTTVKAAVKAAAEKATECDCTVAFDVNYTALPSGSEATVVFNITVEVGNLTIVVEDVDVTVIVD